MKIIALCLNLPEFNSPGAEPFHEKIADKYPGSHWALWLRYDALNQGYFAVSGIVAKQMITEKLVTPKDVVIVQEQTNDLGIELAEMGCERKVLFCLESPVYAPYFYRDLEQIKKDFPRQILFGDLGTDRAYFPSYDENRIPEILPWEKRTKELCVVISNKRAMVVPEAQKFIEHDLFDRRTEAMNAWKPEIYGKGWPGRKEIPPGEKVQVMRDYRYALCFENVAMRGYVTEKIIDCFLAGVVPIYEGAPDIRQMIKISAFSDAFLSSSEPPQSRYNSWYDKIDALIVETGQRFLRSPEGRKFSYQSFSKTVLDCLHI